MRILAVDDDTAILDLLIEGLAVSGYKNVVTANSGEAAIKVLASSEVPFDCFLVDIQMPGIDGVALCRHIRDIKTYANTPIVMVTAMSQKSYIDRAFTAGATDYITKPFDFLDVGTRLTLAKKQAETAAINHTLTKAASSDPAQNIHSLCEPIEILGVDHVVGYVAFENYVLQLTRSHLFLSSVFALKIAGIEHLYAKQSTAEFNAMLCDVAQLITDHTDPVGTLLSYRGNGVFICMNHKGSKHAHNELERQLQDAAAPLFSNINSVSQFTDIKLILGEQTSLGVLSLSGSLNHLRRAIDKVETKALLLKEAEIPAEASPLLDASNATIVEDRKLGYELFLRDSLKDAPSLLELRQA